MHGHEGRTAVHLVPDLVWDVATMTAPPGQKVALPTGTVTFLLTDVETSTLRWEAEADEMAVAIARHYELLDAVVAAHGGMRPVEQGEGDSIVAAFARAADAVHAALDAQRRLQSETWPTVAPLKVRIAVHTGDARLRDEANYAGNTIIRAARLRAIAHGGQVVLSSATRDLVVDELGADADLLDLGVHRLKDLSRPEHVWQLAHADIETDFPPLRSLDAVPNNLPVSLSSFIGRFDAIDTVARLVFENRLITLTGFGGTGKTRLAQQVAAEVTEAFPDGVWWVDLSAVTEPALVASAISRAALLPEDRVDRLGGVVRRLSPKRALVVLDNCEHLLDASAEVAAALLTSCPAVSVLATSRASLNIPGELSWRVPSMALPPTVDQRDRDAARQHDAVRLFIDRAVRANPGFQLTDDNVAAVIEVCDRLEGVPLAIELAAARCRVLTPAQIVEGLADAIGLLASGQRGVGARHQTIEGSIRWSHSLLTEPEQRLLRRLAVFAAPFTVDAAKAVAAGDGITGPMVLTLLEGLVDQSLVQMSEDGAVARFRMLETVRQFATRQLEDSGEVQAVAARHAEHFATRGLGLWPLFGRNMSELLDLADAEFGDLTAMLAHLERHATPERHAEVAMACLPGIAVRHVAEAAALGARVEARVDPLSVLGGRLHLQLALVDPTAPQHVGVGLAAAEATGDPELIIHAGFWASWNDAQDNPTRDKVATLHAARESLRAIGEDHFSRADWAAIAIERSVGRHADTLPHWQRAATETICKRCSAMVWSEGTLLALSQGELELATHSLERALSFALEVRDAGFIAHARLSQTELAVYTGQPWPVAVVEAELADGVATGHPMITGYLSEARAVGAIADGRPDEADADLLRAIELLEGWPQRTEARLRLAALRQARGERVEAAETIAELRADAARWEAGPWLLAQLDHRDASLALDAGDAGAADEFTHRALAAAAVGPWPPVVVAVLELLASVAVARESYLESARLHGAADQLREVIGFRYRAEPDRSRFQRDLTVAREVLGDGAFDAGIDEGRALSLEAAVEYAQRARGERRRPSHGWDGLTPTERKVADLAVRGLTNAQIASELIMGRETVKTHLSSVYAKVGVANRTQLVADAARRGLTT